MAKEDQTFDGLEGTQASVHACFLCIVMFEYPHDDGLFEFIDINRASIRMIEKTMVLNIYSDEKV